MPIDTTPSTVATNALQAIPFESLIGAPLDACIKAQAGAAKTSWEFIREVGLTIDPDTGEKKAVNVSFEYNNNGQITTLIVPLLVIVPIPYLAIDTVDIDFIANISAASSSVEETSSDTDLGVDASAEAKLGVGPFSLSVKANANYSSKQHSKASQDSRYSVEYTMGVKVHAGQADMPAGLTTILNILQGSITSVNPEDSLTISPANVVQFTKLESATLQTTVKDTHGVLAAGTKVTLEVIAEESPFKTITVEQGVPENGVQEILESGDKSDRTKRAILRRYGGSSAALLKVHNRRTNALLAKQTASSKTSAFGLTLTDGATKAAGATDQQGTIIFRMTLDEDVFKGTEFLQGKLKIIGDVPVAGADGENQINVETQEVSYLIIPRGPDALSTPAQLTTGEVSEVTLSGTGTVPVTVTATGTDGETPVEGLTITASVDGFGEGDNEFANILVSNVSETDPTPTSITAVGTTDGNGEVTFTFQALATATDGSGTVTFKGSDNGSPIQLALTVSTT